MKEFKFGDTVYIREAGYKKFGYIKKEGGTATLLDQDNNNFLYNSIDELYSHPFSPISDILKTLIENNRKNKPDSFSPFMSLVDFKKEFCTIRLNPGRLSGKTSAIKNLLTGKDLAYSTVRTPGFTRLDPNGTSIPIFGNKPDVLFIDEASRVPNEMLDYIYKHVQFNQLVLVG